MKANVLPNTSLIYSNDYVKEYESYPRKRMQKLIPYLNLKPNEALLDVGCGPGWLLDMTAGTIGRYVGIDFSKEFIQGANARLAEMNIPNARFECSDIVEFCQKNVGVFDKATLFDVSHLIEDPKLLPIYRAIRSTLKPGGRLYIHTLNSDYFLELLKSVGLVRRRLSSYYSAVRNENRNAELLYRVGYTAVSCRGITHYLFPLNLLHFLSYIPLVGRFFKARLLLTAIA